MTMVNSGLKGLNFLSSSCFSDSYLVSGFDHVLHLYMDTSESGWLPDRLHFASVHEYLYFLLIYNHSVNMVKDKARGVIQS